MATPVSGSNSNGHLHSGFFKDKVYVPPTPWNLQEFQDRTGHAIALVDHDILSKVCKKVEFCWDVLHYWGKQLHKHKSLK
jgi:hypothetical protein